MAGNRSQVFTSILPVLRLISLTIALAAGSACATGLDASVYLTFEFIAFHSIDQSIPTFLVLPGVFLSEYKIKPSSCGGTPNFQQ